jgi:hypothetical protein
MEFHDRFLLEAFKDTNLQIFREEAMKSVKKHPLPEDSGSDSEGEHSDGLEDGEITPHKETKKPGQRRYSKTLLKLIHKYNPRLKCNGSDISCLLKYHTENVENYAFEDKEKFAEQLKMITSIFTHLIPSTSYLRNVLVMVTGSFKDIFVEAPFNEDEKRGEHLKIVAKWVRAPKAQVVALLQDKERRLNDKLLDGYSERFDHVEQVTREMLSEGLTGTVSKKNSAGIIMACQTSIGCRRGEILDPAIKFMTYAQFERNGGFSVRHENYEGDDSTLRIGVVSADARTGMELKDHVSEEFLSHVIVQVGVHKDVETRQNKRIADESKHAVARNVIKPSIIFSAQVVVDAIRELRKKHNITKETYTGPVKATNSWGSVLFNSSRKVLPQGSCQIPAKRLVAGLALRTKAVRRVVFQHLRGASAVHEPRKHLVPGVVQDGAGTRGFHCDDAFLHQRFGQHGS